MVKTVDRQKADQLKVPMEQALWSNPYNATLYATPNLSAWSSTLQGPVINPTQYRHHLERRHLDQVRLTERLGRRRRPSPAAGSGRQRHIDGSCTSQRR